MLESIAKRLKPSSVETIRAQLEFQRSFHPEWIAFHFPAIEDRGTPVEYADVVNMTAEQADSVRHNARHLDRVWPEPGSEAPGPSDLPDGWEAGGPPRRVGDPGESARGSTR